MRRMPLLLTVLAITASIPGQAQEPVTNKEYRIDSDTSWLRVLAYPDGPLKRFGHHHVISHHGISGTVEVAPDPLDSTFMLEITVADLDVDNPDTRALEGEDFEGEVPQKGYRRHPGQHAWRKAAACRTISDDSDSVQGN